MNIFPYLVSWAKGLFKGRQAIQKVFANSVWLSIDKGIRLILYLIVTTWMARYLGPEGYGLFAYASAIVAVLSILSGVGIEGILVRDLVHEDRPAHTLMGTTFVLRIGGGLIVCLCAYMIGWLASPQRNEVRWYALFFAIGNTFLAFDVIDQWFQSKLLSKRTVLAKNAVLLSTAVIKCLFIHFQAPLKAFVAISSIELMAGGAALWASYRTSGEKTSAWRYEWEEARKILFEVWPLVLSGLAVAVYMRLDQILLGQMKGISAVGVYIAGSRLTEFTYVIPAIVMTSSAPVLFQLSKTNNELFHYRLEQIFRLLVWSAISIALPITFLAGPIVHRLYGPAYQESVHVLSISIWTSVFAFLNMAQHPWSLAKGQIGLSALRTVLAAGANIGLNLWLIPRLGPVGSSIAALISFALVGMGLNILHGQTRGIFWMQCRAFYPIPLFRPFRDLFIFHPNGSR